jgi:hypothetical protein
MENSFTSDLAKQIASLEEETKKEEQKAVSQSFTPLIGAP